MDPPPEHCSVNEEAAWRQGMHKIAGPLLVGGVDFLLPRTAIFRDYSVRSILSTRKQFEAYLEFRDQACRIAAAQMVSMINSPVDLFLLTKDDVGLFEPLYAEYMALGDEKTFLGDRGDGSLSANIPNRHKGDIKRFKDEYFSRLDHVRRYFVYRKGLLKLEFIKWNSDPEEVLKRLKTSTRWSELKDHDLKRGLKSHMYLLKKLEMSEVNISEVENVAMKEINSELGLELEKYVGRYDYVLMDNYFERMRYMNLARECATQAQMAGIIILEEALPIRLRSFSKKQTLSKSPNVWRSPCMKQTVKQAFETSLRSLRCPKWQLRRGAGRVGRVWPLVALSILATGAALGNHCS